VQPTDLGLVGFRASKERYEDREEDERVARPKRKGLLAMKVRIYRLMITLGTIAAVALAGGASAKGF
jgi:hypothetical protein